MKLASRLRRSIWSVPVGLQLSLIYALLFAAILALLGWALYVQLDTFLVQNTAQRLAESTGPAVVRRFPGGREGGPGSSIPGGRQQRPDPVTAAGFLVRELTRSDVAVAVIDNKGQIVSASQNLETGETAHIPAPPEGWLDKVQNGSSAQWVVSDPGFDRQLVVVTPIIFTDPAQNIRESFYLEQVASLAAADAVLNQLRLYIALGILIGTVTGVVAGMALTRVTLRPLDRMVGTAEAIAAGDLDRRLHMPSGHNEVARLGSAFDHMVDRLSAALEAQRRFVADASHELRTPLTSMEGLSEMLLIGADRGDTRVVQRTVRAMHNELGRLGRLVTDLLTLSRLDSTMPMPAQAVDLTRLVAEVAEQMRPLAGAKQVNLVLNSQDPVVTQGDQDKLKQVVLNLVDNALRYTPEGGEIRLSARNQPSSGEARVDVQDTGPGIAPEDLPHVFERFYRGDVSRARATGNSGLGLAIARAIVQAHGGTLSVESPPGSGAHFTIALPAHRPPDHQAPAVPTRKVRVEEEQVPASRSA